MRRHVFIEIFGSFDSLALWSLIGVYGVNLTDVDDKAWVYGDVELNNIGALVSRCALFGPIKVDIAWHEKSAEEGVVEILAE